MSNPSEPEVMAKMAADPQVKAVSRDLFDKACSYRYSYNWSWLGRPIIQFPEDIVVYQEIIWRVKPDIIVETGIAHGGSLILSASLLELAGGKGEVLGLDIDIRPHNREAIEAHPLAHRISMIQGSSIDPQIIAEVHARCAGKRVLVVLDSNHTHEHVADELAAYAPLVSIGSYCIVFDTVIEDMPEDAFPNRPWGRGNNPKTAVHEFLKNNDSFEIDREIQNKLLLTVAPDGYLRRLK
ncbi:MAG: cephalosporin hydroxylase family protein [Magnetospirillum sp.]|nr:cephalosporin hydroxylase family protein [Magnetospirillum sp.]